MSKKMQSYTIINVNELLENLMAGNVDAVMIELETYLDKANRDHVLNEQEILKTFARFVHVTAEKENKTNDRLTNILWPHVSNILRSNRVIS